MGRLADQLFGRAFVDDEEEYQRRVAEEASQSEVAPPSPDVAMTLPVAAGPSAPQGTMPTAQEQDVPVGPQPWQQTATDIAESAPGRFVRAAAEAVPKTLENVGTVAGMMVGAPLIAQGAKAIPGIAATALQVARNPLAALRERPMAGPAAALAAEVATEPEKMNPATGGPAVERFSDPAVAAAKAAQRSGPLAALGRKAVSGPAMPSELQGMARVSRDANFASNTVEYNNLMVQAKEARKRGDFAKYTRLRSEAGKFSPSYFTGRPIVESVPALPADPVERMRVINRGMAQRRVTPEITAQKEAAIAARNAEAKAASEAEAAALEAERGPSVDPFRDATDAEAARRRASTLDLGGERGAALIPGKEQFKEVASHFQFHPKLEKYLLDTGYSVADAAARLRTANAAEPWLAKRDVKSILRDVPLGQRFKAWVTGSQTKDAKAFRQYAVAADELENVNRGQQVGSGRVRSELEDAMRDAEASVGSPRMQELIRRQSEITDAGFDELVDAGEIDRSAWRPSHVRNIYTDKVRERLVGFGTRDKGAPAAPGAANTRKGWEGEKEDIFGSIAFGRHEAGKAYNRAKIIREPVIAKFGQNEAIRQNPAAALQGDTVLFTFDYGETDRIKNQFDTRRFIDAHPDQLNPAFKGQPFIEFRGNKNVKYHAIPGELAEGLQELMANEGEFGKFSQIMAKANQVTTTSLLSFPVTNVPYQIGQLMSDTSSAFQAVAGMGSPIDIATWKGPRILAKETAKGVRDLAAEYFNVYWRKLRPTLFRKDARENLFGVNFESMYEDITADGGVATAELITRSAKPLHEQGLGAGVKAFVMSPFDLVDATGKVRENTLMRGIAKASEELIPGMSRPGAVALARREMGGYDKKSAAGRAFAPLMLFHKWFLSAAQNLTTRALQDPLTKKWNGWKRLPAGVKASPIIGVGITLALQYLWNQQLMGEWGRQVAKDVLPSTQTGGFVMPFTATGKYVGPGADLSGIDIDVDKPVIVEPESYLQVSMAGASGAADVATGNSGRALEDIARFTASRGAPIALGPIEALTGERLKDGSSIMGNLEGSSRERQIEELKRRGVWWADALDLLPSEPMNTEHVLERLSYAPSFLRRAAGKEQTEWETAQTYGSPFRVVDPQAKAQETRHRELKPLLKRADRLLLAVENGGRFDEKAWKETIDQMKALGADSKVIKGQLTRWRNATRKNEVLTRPEREEMRERGLPDPFGDWLKTKQKPVEEPKKEGAAEKWLKRIRDRKASAATQ